jgi:hypothetical protein
MSSPFTFTSYTIAQLRANLKKHLINLPILWLSLNNTQQPTPAQENESHHLLHTAEEMDLDTKLVGLYCEETSAQHKVEGTQLTATMEGTQLTVTRSAITSLSQSTTSLKTAKEAVLDAMRSQFFTRSIVQYMRKQ